jgi:hypothetical protein
MDYLVALGVVLAWMLVLLVCLEIGRRFGRRRLARHGADARRGLGAVEGAVFGLLGLLLAFSFSAAADRFEEQRQLSLQEANAIRTAYRRLDLLPAETQPQLRAAFSRYLDARKALYARFARRESTNGAIAGAALLLRDDLWTPAVEASRKADNAEVMTVTLPAINEMSDLTLMRIAAIRTHDPGIILGFLMGLVMICSVLAGSASAEAAGRSWIHIISFAAVLSVSVYSIADYEYWWLGLIKVDAADEVLEVLRKSMP